jgi:nucleotide-binding universal stress UspA family protein
MKFLVAIDGSDASAHALDRALLLARPSGAKLMLLSVVEPPADYFWPPQRRPGHPRTQRRPLS